MPVEPAALCPADAQALDRALEDDLSRLLRQISAPGRSASGSQTSRDEQSDEDAQRLECVRSWLKLIASCPTATPTPGLIDRTVDLAVGTPREPRPISIIGSIGLSGGGGSFRLSDIWAAAAVVLIGISLLWPTLDRTRAESRRVACASNLAAIGQGLNQYAISETSGNRSLPRNRTQPGAAWWEVGRMNSQPAGADGNAVVRSNSAHAYLLIRLHYVRPENFNCPENASAPQRYNPAWRDWPNAAAVSYSYQNQYTPQAIRIDRSPNLAVFADKNPLFVFDPQQAGVRYRATLPENAASEFHRNRGQNILLISGQVRWSRQPIIDHSTGANPTASDHDADNIWLANGVKQYQGNETPQTPDDAFLVP
ncbi:MAG: hypothetical protein GC164_05895 [Phycisphaera sp.]|nr:hypothetical protein [Phycisphaera sp.]